MRLLTLVSGSIIVVIWTFIRHFSNGVNFDVVGQVGLVDQWTHGLHAGAQVGPTNYILKMPFYIVANSLHFLSPNDRLLVLALLFNLLTFWLLLVLFEKILDLYNLKNKTWLYMGMIWLATISGSVFWVDYANSRNLETVGGILFLYLTLKFLKRPSYRAGLVLTAVGGVAFFADSLQVFAIGIPLCLYVFGRWIFVRSKQNAVSAVGIGSATVGAYIVAKILFWLSTIILPVSYLNLPSAVPSLTLSNAGESVKSVFISTLKIFDSDFFKKPYTLNSIRELLDAAILIAVAYMAVRILLQKRAVPYPKVLILLIIVVNYAVYVASGQALQVETERYLIMVPLITVLLVAFWGANANYTFKPRLLLAWAACLVISSGLLFGALIVSVPSRYSKDAPRTDTITFLRSHGFQYAVTSREIGIPATYYALRTPTVLPTQCSADHRLIISTLFFDKASFAGLQHYKGDVPVILQNDGIKDGNYDCHTSDIIHQFGMPKSVLVVPGVGVAQIYDAQTLELGN
jgi:hypothetical protein